MKVAFISDIHANVTALRLVLEAIAARRDVQHIYCLGDVVGLHLDPGDCIDMLQDHHVECIAGNHDDGVTGRLGREKFPPECWESIEWTRKRLTQSQKRFLEALPRQRIVGKRLWLMHGIFGDPYHYMIGVWKHRYALSRLRLSGVQLGVYGHIHTQTCYRSDGLPLGVESLDVSRPVSLDAAATYLLNPGAVGQPRVRDAHARFAVVDLENNAADFQQIAYDYESIVRRTLDVFPGHAGFYARSGWSVANG